MFGKDIGIDLGTANILIYVKGEGIVLDEPSVVAVESNSKKVLAVGEDAYKMLGRTPGKVESIKPLKDGVIANFELTVAMLDYFIKKVQAKNSLSKPTILICCPTNITEVEKEAIKEVAEVTGAKKVYIEEEPKVAAVGAGLDISKPNGNMVIDIGGGTTDIAVLSLGDIVTSKSLKIAGNTFDQKIIDYIKEKYKLLIGERTAEDIKIEIGSAIKEDKKSKKVIKGRNLETGLPSSKTITSNEIYEALESSLYEIIDGAKNVLETTLPELSADIVENGVVLTGGGALLNGIDTLFFEELKIPVKVAESPLTCVVDGTGIMLNNLNLIEK
ncbi:MAG: rod shape-determining protein [Bacilli bacterium]|nr:rod shape-determining protein [Bacilli bacterium]